MIIFIPVLLICVSSQCEFMQARAYYQTDAQCRAVLEAQKIHMLNLVLKSGKGVPELIEGTCIEADVNTRSKTEKDT
jgi:hypothetical protein